MLPFLKYAGGKRWFIAKYSNLLPKSYGRYIEPFLGGGTVFFHLSPSKAILGDLNADLISTYLALKNNWQAVISILRKYHDTHDKDHYYKVRDEEPLSSISKAARFIYLNRTCFNGIYRVNSQGKFNVPIGTTNTVLLEKDDFEKISRTLAGASLNLSDFETLINEARKNDLIFADPPYTVRHNNNGFISYNEKLFSWDDQVRLSQALSRAKSRGAKIILTNANHSTVRELYEKQGFSIKTVSRYSSISALPQNRKQFEELIVLANIKNK